MLHTKAEDPNRHPSKPWIALPVLQGTIFFVYTQCATKWSFHHKPRGESLEYISDTKYLWANRESTAESFE